MRCKINHATESKLYQVLYFMYICVGFEGKVHIFVCMSKSRVCVPECMQLIVFENVCCVMLFMSKEYDRCVYTCECAF